MAQVPSQLRGSPTRIVPLVMRGCQLRTAYNYQGKPVVVVEPPQFIRPHRARDGRMVFA